MRMKTMVTELIIEITTAMKTMILTIMIEMMIVITINIIRIKCQTTNIMNNNINNDKHARNHYMVVINKVITII